MFDAIQGMIQSTAVQILALAVLGILLFLRQRMKKVFNGDKDMCDADGVPVNDEIAAEIFVATRITEQLTEIRMNIEAKRVYVFQFHNGDVWTNGSSILRMTCSHESVVQGVSSLMGHCNSVLISTVQQAVAFLMKFQRGDTPVYAETRDVESGYYKNILITSGVEATIQYPLYRADEIIGYLGADFDDIDTKSRENNKATEAQYQKELKKKLTLFAEKAAGVEYWVNKKGKTAGIKTAWGSWLVRKLK